MLTHLIGISEGIWTLCCYVLKMNPLQDLSSDRILFGNCRCNKSGKMLFRFFKYTFAGTIISDSFLSDNWRRQAFFLKSLFSFHFVTVKGITKSLTRSWAMSGLVIATVLACKHQLEQSHMGRILFWLMFSFKEWHTWPNPFFAWTEL